MPELPEVETVRRGLEPSMRGVKILKVLCRRDGLRFPFPDAFAQRLKGRTIEALGRRAKYLLVVEIHIIILDIYAFPTTGRSNVRTMTLVKLIFLSSRMLNRDLHQGRPWLASSAVSDKERCRPTVRSSLHMVAERESGCTALLNSTVHG